MLSHALVCMIATSSITTLHQTAAGAWRPAARPTRSQWCQQHIKLPAETGAQPGGFDLADHAYLREPLDAVDDPEVREIVFPGGTQIGKSTLLHAIALSQGEVDRAPMLFGGPDQSYAREQRRLIYRIADETPILKRRVPPERRRNDQWIDLEKCLVYLAWSGSRQRLSGRSCKIVLCSEVDGWKEVVTGGAVDPKKQRRQSSIHLATQRTKAFWRSVVIYEGTPVGPSPVIWPLYRDSDRRTFRVPCPRCGHYQEIRFFPHKSGPRKDRGGVAGLQDKQGNWKTPDQARRDAYYVCEAKGCRITSDQKAAMIRRGVWCPDGCRVDRRGRVIGTPKSPGRRRGYHVNSLYSATITFGDAAEEYLKVRDTTAGLQSFFNDWLGLPFEPRGSTPKWKDLGLRLAGSVPRGVVPRSAYFLVATADVQAHGCYWIVRGFGDRKTSWLIDFGYLSKDRKIRDEGTDEALASDLAKLGAQLLWKQWPVDGQNPRGLSALRVRTLGVDRGYRQTDVDRFVAAHPGDRVIAVFGSPAITAGALYRPMKTSRDVRSGKLADDGLSTWGIETNAYRNEISDRWFADRSQPGVWWLPSDILGTAGGEDFLRQVTAESRQLENVHGRKVIRWKLISHDADNHYWDCEVYAAAIADMVVGGQWDAATWPSEPVPSKRDTADDQAEIPGDWSAR